MTQPYLHQSRHEHANKRVRGPHGRFLTAEEIQKLSVDPASGSQEDEAPAASIDASEQCGTPSVAEGAAREALTDDHSVDSNALCPVTDICHREAGCQGTTAKQKHNQFQDIFDY